MPTFWLSMHVPYVCRHAGACCSSGWPIPLETTRVAVMQTLRPDRSWLLSAPAAPPDVAGMLAVSANGHCVFHRNGCEVQHAFGHRALPTACQHFPREVLIDRRGVFVTLSHYCPTAADLLFEHEGPVNVVEGPPAVSGGVAEGLDAREALPPLLTDAVLADDEGYGAWEQHMIWALTQDDGQSPEEALAHLRRDLTIVQRWRPGGPALAEGTVNLSARLRSTSTSPERRRRVPASIVIRRFLAARAFASWVAYQGSGLAAVLGSLELTLDVLREQIAQVCPTANEPLDRTRLKEAIRQTDLALVHEMPRDELARRSSARSRSPQ